MSLEKALTALAALRNSEQLSQRGVATVNVVDQLLEDLDAGTRGATRSPSDVRLMDTRQMAASAIAVEIVS